MFEAIVSRDNYHRHNTTAAAAAQAHKNTTKGEKALNDYLAKLESFSRALDHIVSEGRLNESKGAVLCGFVFIYQIIEELMKLTDLLFSPQS